MSKGPYAPLNAYAAAAKGRAELWRTAVGAMAILVLYFGSLFLMVVLMAAHFGEAEARLRLSALAEARTPGTFVCLFFTFLAMLVAPLAVARVLHGRGPGSLIGPMRRAARDLTVVAGTTLAVSLLLMPFALTEAERAADLPFGTFLAWAPLALVAILIQTAAEELVFRGYLLQQLAVRFASPVIWALVPALLFAWGHHSPATYGPNALLICLWAAAFGLAAADLTARTGTIGAAVGLHFANNIAALLLIGVEGQMDGLALWTRAIDLRSPEAMGPLLAVDLATIFVAWLAARAALRV